MSRAELEEISEDLIKAYANQFSRMIDFEYINNYNILKKSSVS